MKAPGRIMIAISLALAGGSPSFAQNSETPPPEREVIGNPQIQDFSLNGTVTRRTDPGTEPAARPAPAQPRPQPPAATAQSPAPRSQATARQATIERPAASERSSRAESPSIASPVDGGIFTPAPRPSATDSGEFASIEPVPSPLDPADSLAPDDDGPSIWPWLLALAALGGAVAYYFRYLHDQRPREALAGMPSGRAAAPEPDRAADTLRRRPVVQPPAPASSGGVVSARLRPWLDLDLNPGRLILTEQGITIDLQIDLYNSGAAPARDVRIDARIVNAGSSQDQDIEEFFAFPDAKGNPIPLIDPLNRGALPISLHLPLAQVRMFEAAGRRFFIPLVAINVSYRGGQSSAAWLLGRDNKGEKLAPFRADLGERQFRGLEARRLNQHVRK